MEAILNAIPSVVMDHPYAFLAAGLFIAGDSVLIPAVYLAALGRLDPAAVAAISLASMLTSDCMWFWIGGHLERRVFRRMVDGRLKRAIDKLSGAFSRRSSLVLYLSKFVYGTRIAAEILAGANRMRPLRFVAVDLAGLATLVAIFFALGYAAAATASSFESVVHGAEIALAVFAAVIVLGHLAMGSYMKRLGSSSPKA